MGMGRGCPEAGQEGRGRAVGLPRHTEGYRRRLPRPEDLLHGRHPQDHPAVPEVGRQEVTGDTREAPRPAAAITFEPTSKWLILPMLEGPALQ